MAFCYILWPFGICYPVLVCCIEKNLAAKFARTVFWRICLIQKDAEKSAFFVLGTMIAF
jgi:hypothetical protein